ncbi:hypothetical protein XENTR_v10020166 [Xenopus tropicalis]|nr:hypothetical protein XENTR_v10020166 [Xenopus tropicalis]
MAMTERTYFLCTASFILVLGATAAHELITYENATSGTIGQSVLLPISYRLARQFASYTIQWETGNWTILYYRVTNSTTDPQGCPTWENGKATIFHKYKGRVQFFGLNGSLILWDLQLNDTGSYRVVLTSTGNITEKQIRVTITETPISSDAQKMPNLETIIIRTILCFCVVFVLVFLIIRCECQPASQMDRCTTCPTQGWTHTIVSFVQTSSPREEIDRE